MMAEIIAAIRSLGAIAGLLRDLVTEVNKLSQAMEEKQIEEFKRGVNETLQKIEKASNDADRKLLIVELSRRLSK
jgi:hypothetical protein